jgi:hypothetical protein
MRSYLEQVNLPTREDITRLGELIVALEEKVDQLDDRLAGIEATLRAQTSAKSAATPSAAPTSAPPAEPSAPARTRRQASARGRTR